MTSSWAMSDWVLGRALATLERYGYRTSEIALQDIGETVQVAEDAYSVILVLTAPDWPLLRQRAMKTEVAFANWAAAANAGPKQWDLYLVLLLRGRMAPEWVPSAEALCSDTRFARKIVRTVSADTEDVFRTALAPLLPFRLATGSSTAEPLQMLEARLTQRGVAPDMAARAIESFRRVGRIDLA